MSDKTRFCFVEYRTSETNHARVLLGSSSIKKVCVVLDRQRVGQLSVIKVNAAGIPEECTTADQAQAKVSVRTSLN